MLVITVSILHVCVLYCGFCVYNVMLLDAAALAAVQGGANKAAYGTNYTGVPTTRQLTVPPISAKGQANSNSTPYSAQYASPQSSATNYHYSNTATTNKVCTISAVT